jgi:hypothetical protein
MTSATPILHDMLGRRAQARPMRPRFGSVIVIVLWAIGISAIILTAVQLSSFRQAAMGREAVDRMQARWAARGGIEHTIAIMAYHTERPVRDDALALVRDMEYVAFGNLVGAGYDIRHHAAQRDWFGPMDEHSKMNVNMASMPMLMLLENMWLDIAEAILEWRDGDFNTQGFGLGRDYYLSMNPPYEPRWDRYQNIAELELVAGVWPKYLRGEDWNLNNRLDPSENDGGVTFPPDNGDGVLDAGWAGLLTAYTVAAAPSGSGQPRILLPKAKIAEVVERLDVEDLQARALIRFGRSGENPLEQLLVMPISHIDALGRPGETPYNAELPDLTPEQLRAVFDELTMDDSVERKPGKMNINTVSPDLLRGLLELHQAEPYIADEILYLRDSAPLGIASLLDLMAIPEITPDLLLSIARLFDTRSSVYSISSRGRAWGTGAEVEIIAVVDRSTVPVRIIEYREQ